jgi:hypothetical protein
MEDDSTKVYQHGKVIFNISKIARLLEPGIVWVKINFVQILLRLYNVLEYV